MKIELLLTKLNELGDYRFHMAKNGALEALARSDEEWQCWQEHKGIKNRFPAQYIVAFANISGNNFLFGGIYEIIERLSDSYKVRLLDDHQDLVGRLVIKCPVGRTVERCPKQILEDAVISEVYSTRYRGEKFKSISSINHNYNTLETVFKNELHDWKFALSNVKGVYLLTNNENGKSYVGSASGENGIWQRWSDYIFECTGGNKELIELKENFTEDYFKKNFKFSVLETVGSSATTEEIIDLENLWKDKLLTRAHGYNAN